MEEKNMFQRLHLYFKERYPLFTRFILGIIVFGEIHFIILLNNGITKFDLGIQEFVGMYTIFAFLLWLRIADDLKDYETDMELFPDRPLPSGRTKKKDIIIAAFFFETIALVLNFIFMPNFIYCVILYIYGYLMRNWFFKKNKISKSLPLALVTHNPVQMFINLYTISFTCIKYNLAGITLINAMTLFTLYFPALIWEISRKIRAPKDETEYTTYSKLFGYKKSTRFVMIMTLVDIVTNIILVWNLNKVSVAVLIILVSWMTWKFIDFMKDPTRYKIVDKVERYTYLQESTMLLTVIVFLIVGKI